MYVRFHSPWAEVRRGVHYGLFGPAGGCAHDLGVSEGLREAIWTELDWFADQLPVPRRRAFVVKSKKRWRSVGICWFKDDAREMIAHAFTLAWLLRECGVPVTKRTARARSSIATISRSSRSRKRQRRRCGTSGFALAQ